MKYRMMVSVEHTFPTDLSATMPLGLPYCADVLEDGGIRAMGTKASRFDFELPDGITFGTAQKVGQGFAFIAGFNAYNSVSRLFVLKHSNDTNVGKRSTDWAPVYE
jgi:hypothetical protein